VVQKRSKEKFKYFESIRNKMFFFLQSSPIFPLKWNTIFIVIINSGRKIVVVFIFLIPLRKFKKNILMNSFIGNY